MDEDDLKDWDMDFVREFSNRVSRHFVLFSFFSALSIGDFPVLFSSLCNSYIILSYRYDEVT